MYLDREKSHLSVNRFSGGMNRFDDSAAIGDFEYVFLQNGRVRDGKVRPVKNPLQLKEGLPTGIEGITVNTTIVTLQQEITFSIELIPYGNITTVSQPAIIRESIEILLDGVDITDDVEITFFNTKANIKYTHRWGTTEVHTIRANWLQSGFSLAGTDNYVANFSRIITFGAVTPTPIVHPITINTGYPLDLASIRLTADGSDLTTDNQVVITEANITLTPSIAWAFGSSHRVISVWRDYPPFPGPTPTIHAQIIHYESQSFTGANAGTVESITQQIEAGGINVQGIFTAQDYMIVFQNGEAYYKNYANPSVTEFSKVPGFQMSKTAPRIYSWLVPGSTVNFKRTASIDGPDATISLGAAGKASDAVLLCQDGVSRPRLIFPNASSREAKSFAQWTIQDREYVPIGLMGMYFNGINYIVSKDRKKLLRSPTGRPLDFVIAVDGNGNKLADGLFEEEAERTAHRVDYEDIIAIRPLNTNNGEGFLVSTINNSYIVSPNFDVTFWGEPGFNNTFLFSTGALNENSIADLIGDTVLINTSGIRSFNAVLQSQNEGKNSPFHARIANLFGPEDNQIEQDVTACIGFNDYVFFGIKTIFGYGILVYDSTREIFVAFDQFSNMGAIKEFRVLTRSGGNRKLFGLDGNGKIWELYGGTSTAECKFYLRDWSTNDPELLQIPRRFKTVFENIEADGTVICEAFCDKKKIDEISETIEQNILKPTFPVLPPFGTIEEDTIENLSFVFESLPECWKTGIMLSWSVMAELVLVGITSEVIEKATSNEQAAKAYAE